MSMPLAANDLTHIALSDVVIGESNHRIANNLTLIAGLLRLQAADIAKAGRSLSAQDVCVLLEEAGGRIETVGRLHRLLAQVSHGEALNLHQFLHDIAEAAIGSMALAGDMVLAPMTSAACTIPAQQALPIGFIVGELVTNAVKYAHPAGVPGQVALDCQRRPEGAILIQVTDDGVGLPDGFDPRTGGGLGMRMVRMLSDQLGASLTLESTGLGLTVRLLVPPARLVSVELLS
jgi:two-component sensor histidine kinase